MKALVTGGSGFLGGAIVRALRARGDEVRSLSRREGPRLSTLGVRSLHGDIFDADVVRRAVAGVDLFFHVAGKAGMWGKHEEYRRTNLVGTQNVLAACRAEGVGRLVYTSTPSVVHAGGDIEGGDESLPYPAHFDGPYPETKAAAERAVLAANAPDLATVALRPHLIWGPGDNHLIPRLLARARAGRMAYVGRADKLIDTTYIDNAAAAHLAAADGLSPAATMAGKAYFISQGDPRPASEITNAILAAAGLPPVHRRVPFAPAFAAGALCEILWRGLGIETEPPLTRFVVRQMSTAHWYDISAARRDLGYEPSVSIEEGLQRLRSHFADGADH